MYLLIDSGVYDLENLDFYNMSLELKMTETKIKNLLHEVQLKYTTLKDKIFLKNLLNLFAEDKFEKDTKNHLKFSIKNPMMRQTFEYWIEQSGGITDTSFNKDIVIVDMSIYHKMLVDVAKNLNELEDAKVKVLKDKLEKYKEIKISNKFSNILESMKDYFTIDNALKLAAVSEILIKVL